MSQFPKNLEMTYQLSLDHFLAEQQELEFDTVDEYQAALTKLEGIKRVRSCTHRYEIARSVVDQCPHCVEAQLAVGLYSTQLDERLHALLQASQLAAIRLGQDYFTKDMQDYYLNKETHLFFRSKTAYAVALFDAGFMRKARPHLETIKRLNPGDIFKVSHYLLSIYLVLEDKESGYRLLQELDEHDAFTCYTKVLYAYKDMEFEEARHWLKAAREVDGSIYQLLCKEPLPYTNDYDSSLAAHFLGIYGKALRGWKDFSGFVKSI